MTSPGEAGHVFLIGFMGAGKTTVGRILADTMGRPFVDLDAQIERDAGLLIPQIFAEKGEDAFRELESEALAGLSESPRSVVACGGGIVLRAENRRVLKNLGTTVYLEVSAGEALARIGDVEGRPLLAEGGPAAAATLLEGRRGLYRAVADLVVETDACDPAQIADAIAARLSRDRAAQ